MDALQNGGRVMKIDNPMVRRDATCPLCLDMKEPGLVLCWPCHRAQKAAWDGCYSEACEDLITAREIALGGEP